MASMSGSFSDRGYRSGQNGLLAGVRGANCSHGYVAVEASPDAPLHRPIRSTSEVSAAKPICQNGVIGVSAWQTQRCES